MGMIEAARRHVSPRIKRKVRYLHLALRSPTSGLRDLPDFLVIGAQRSGTSSLYRYLGQHPCVVPSIRKETEYFSREYDQGQAWYRAHFPTRISRTVASRVRGTTILLFEATPDYLFHPFAAARAARLIPAARIIVMLRDPVARAYSHYRHMLRLGFETLSFDEALSAEPARIEEDVAGLEKNPSYYCRSLMRYSYVSRGLYANQLQTWFRLFPRKSFFILSSEELFTDPSNVYRQILEFLDLPSWVPRHFANYSYSAVRDKEGSQMAVHTQNRLSSVFKTPNEELYSLLDRDFGWL
jgi:hypothetical protein